VDLQPSSLLPPVPVCNRLEHHGLGHPPYRSGDLPHNVACLEDTGNHEPDIFPYGTSPAPISSESRDRPRTSVHPSKREYLCHYRSFHRKPYRTSFLDNASDSRLCNPRLPHRMPRLRSGTGRAELSVLGRAFLCYSHVSRVGSYSWNLALVAPLLSSVLSSVSFGEVLGPFPVGPEDFAQFLKDPDMTRSPRKPVQKLPVNCIEECWKML